MARGRRVAGASRSLVNVRNLQFECARVFHKTLIVIGFPRESMIESVLVVVQWVSQRKDGSIP